MSRPDRDQATREAMRALWERLRAEGQLSPGTCCGGRGLAVGCPSCERRWPS